ncbi:MAG: TIGR00730 family Rossman fold protein [Chlorobium sp.]|uniref:LOG family protein n=1 Tax=Chlorobium sp. TaxID=1095 RepID=UPI0025BBAFD4|nr:TIGR00730 family Rossman fold protein [Chlorobium sp.]MCF8382345.1 TIGR00730 family Rossman fold protein [Chlorobium sp.]
MIRNITVYCSSSNHAPEAYFECARQLGKGMAERGIGLVFGGGNVGLMGCVSDAVMHNGGTVRGIIPRFLEEKEVAHYGISELFVVETMHERKMKLTEWGDAFVILPGGFGTLDELMEIITWKHLGHHRKPILLLNCNGFWEPLLSFFRRIAEEGMVGKNHDRYYTVCSTPEEVFGILETGDPQS